MISYLSGTVLYINLKYIIVNVNGVGYQVFANNNILSTCELTQNIEVFIHTSVKEDSITLFGFKNFEELKFFEQLISISGVGPKTAIEILNQPIELTKKAILTADSATLSRTPGIGKKTAERIILELKNKVSLDMTEMDMSSKSVNGIKNNANIEEAIEALQTLGYKRFEIMKIIQRLEEDISETEEIVKWFLARV